MTAIRSAPAVSVMLPVYNTGRYLAQTLESLLGQTFEDFELVAIDDGSKDGSPAILRRYAARDSRVRVVCRENRGIVTTRNELLSMARGQFLAVNDSDDLSLPDRLRRQVEFLRANPAAVVVGGAFDMIDAAGRRLTTLRPPERDAEIQKAALAGHCAICHSAGMIRRSAMERVGGYNPRYTYAHDLELWLRLGEVGELANLGGEPVIRFRLHGGSVSENKREEQRAFCRLACEEAWGRRGITDGEFAAAEPWRPGRDRTSRHRYAMRYGWWAFANGERRTAMIYGAKAVAALPLNPGGWKLMASAAIKSPAAPVPLAASPGASPAASPGASPAPSPMAAKPQAARAATRPVPKVSDVPGVPGVSRSAS